LYLSRGSTISWILGTADVEEYEREKREGKMFY
jgi:hypothetical protein